MDSNCVPSTQSLSNRSLASDSPAAILRSNVADLERQHCPERTGMRAPLERYCPLISGAKGAPSSCPAGCIAEVGLRWCGATPRNRTEDLDVKACKEATDGVSVSHRSNDKIIATQCGRSPWFSDKAGAPSAPTKATACTGWAPAQAARHELTKPHHGIAARADCSRNSSGSSM